MKRYLQAFSAPILYDAELTLPATVKLAFPTKLPPLRADASSLVVGQMAVADSGESPCKFAARRWRANAPVYWQAKLPVPTPELDHFFLLSLFEQWRKAADRPPSSWRSGPGARGRTDEEDQSRGTARRRQLAVKDHRYDDALRAFQQARMLAPHDPEADAGMRLAQKLKKGI